MRIYLRFYDKDIMLNKIALENAIQSDRSEERRVGKEC